MRLRTKCPPERDDGIFFYTAKEEAGIRNDPAKQTTALLKKVFGAK
ncbi:MAG: DUF4197 domain-containing protein [Proteobacteria bacterium]|nr:DUF4197 domain-containing protein [Pseudomonadota bacterium]MBU1547590.1 DUF4197 domain-containing protein [Pseudomonadota bacterium]MBU2618747.1 DUF4197 domain-containing protein [Pseudomonadota bacterium]